MHSLTHTNQQRATTSLEVSEIITVVGKLISAVVLNHDSFKARNVGDNKNKD